VSNPLEDHAIEVGTTRVAEALEDGSATVVDVREPYEWEAGRIPGVRHIPLDRLAAQAETVDRDRPVIFQCRLGVRSLMAAQAFRRAGFDAYSLEGGIQAWSDERRPLEPEGATVADH
jgi:rhodanese-related sulfurtransferase